MLLLCSFFSPGADCPACYPWCQRAQVLGGRLEALQRHCVRSLPQHQVCLWQCDWEVLIYIKVDSLLCFVWSLVHAIWQLKRTNIVDWFGHHYAVSDFASFSITLPKDAQRHLASVGEIICSWLELSRQDFTQMLKASSTQQLKLEVCFHFSPFNSCFVTWKGGLPPKYTHVLYCQFVRF